MRRHAVTQPPVNYQLRQVGKIMIMKLKENEKMDKYLDLAGELKKL